MKTWNCSILNKLHQCTAVATTNGAIAHAIQTAHRWHDGSPLSFFIIPSEQGILISDDGDTLFHLMAQGIKLHIPTLREKLNSTNSPIQLSEDGEIFTLGNTEYADLLIADYISALCAIMHYEREIIALPKQLHDLTEQVEHHLRLWKPNHILHKNVVVQGISGHQVQFDFEQDKWLILPISPTPQAVGAAMRKAGDVLSGSFLDGREIMVIVDDRSNDLFPQRKIDEEIAIISTLVKAVPLSNLIKASNRNIRH